jgi:hypothetical protein
MYDIVKNPIPHSNLWATPESLEQLMQMCDEYTGEQKALAMHIAMLTLNTCHGLVERDILNKEVFAQ